MVKLKLENIALIKKADITIDGLTVIGGFNDCGKSTIGKLLFASIQAINRYKDDLIEEKDSKLQSDLLLQLIKQKKSEKIVNQEDLFERYQKTLTELREHLSDKEGFKKGIRKALKTELSAELSPILAPQEEGFLELSNQFSLKIKENKIYEIKLEDEKPLFSDCVFIESPLVLQFGDLYNNQLRRSQTLFSRNNNLKSILLHNKDLFFKAQDSTKKEPTDKMVALSDTIEAIISGSFSYDKKQQEFLYTKESGKQKIKVPYKNTASGIKSFGLLSLLLKNGNLKEKDLLILDEPENHLHPEWQVILAKLIIKLVENGISIVVSSHSPYLMQGLRKFSKLNKEVRSKTNFYLAEKDEIGMVNMTNVNENFSYLFNYMSKPFDKLL